MSKAERSSVRLTPHLRRGVSIVMIALNILLLSGAFTMYSMYTEAYEDRLRAENLGNVANLNRSAAVNAASMFDSWRIKLNDAAQYAELHNLSVDETLTMIDESNSSADRFFQLVGSDYKGFLAKKGEDGTFPALDYSHMSYSALQKVIDEADAGGEVRFAPEYTDSGTTAEKFFAMCRSLTLRDAAGQPARYTLLLATRSKNVLAVLNGQGDYKGQATVLIDGSGNYIVSSKDYKALNFFQYLYIYNELSLDEKLAIQREMGQNGSGELYYKNADVVVEDCVFRYEHMSESGWYCVTCVPMSSFHAPAFRISFIIHAIIFLVVMFCADLLWLQGMNRRLRTSIQREKEANAAKGNFMSRMSHEIRTPLNAVIGYNTIARNEMAGVHTEAERKQAEMKVVDCLDKSGIASKHLLTIINDVLDMAAIESGKIKVASERFDFRGLITSLTTVFYTQAREKGVEFEVIFDALTEEWFVGDQMRTSQILTNLLSNAIKFTSRGGSVTLKISQPEAEGNASHLHFEVSDTGIGMTPEYLSHIWTPFEQADSSISRRFGGTGLGLSITKNLIDLMGGTISVRSVPGQGTTFDVDLTFARTEQPQSTAGFDFSAINALVVDDDESTCEYVRMMFNRCGARCAVVQSGARAVEAFSLAQEHGAPFTLCLIDWRMPEMDGIETVHRIRQLSGAKLPIIIMTAYDYAELADEAAEAGVSRFLSKPLFQSALYDLLANISGAPRISVSEKTEQIHFNGARVLLAEDNAMNMEIARTIMETAGLAVDSAWNGREAVDKFCSSPAGTYMAILMDVHMPEMNGHEATRAIRASAHPEAQTIPIIAMTADAFAENVAEARAAGMNEHIAKPIDIPTLFSTLQKFTK